jgi:tetratricopeptide (TPR) repeat protein
MNSTVKLHLTTILNRYGAYLIVFLLPLIVYAPTLTGGFYYDDNVMFLGHQIKHLAENPFSVFSSESQFVPGASRSLHVFLLLCIYRIFGAQPLPYHIITLLLHSITCVLVYIFIKKITFRLENGGSISLLAALIFSLHPMHVENITLVTLGGTDIFMTMWAVLSLILYIRFRESESINKYLLLSFSLLVFAFSILSKETGIAFLFAFPLIEFSMKRKGFAWALPYLIVIMIFKLGLLSNPIASVQGTGASGGWNTEGGFVPVFESAAYFVKSLIFPYPQSVMVKEFGSLVLSFSYLLLAVLCVGITYYSLPERRMVLFSALLFIIAISPYLLVPYIPSMPAVSAERYTYPSSIGFSLFMALVMVNILKAKTRLRVVAAIILLTYSALGMFHFFDAWRTEEAFWQNVINRNPDYTVGYVSLSNLENKAGRTDKARELLVEALKKPKGAPYEFSNAAYGLGMLASQSNDLRDAERYYIMSINYANNQMAYINLGYLYLQAGKLNNAKQAFNNALKFRTRSSRALYGLAKTYDLIGNRRNARYYAMKVVRMSNDKRLRELASELLK